MTKRHKVFIWIYLNLLGIKDGERLSDGAMLVRFFLMPLNTFYWLLHERMKMDGRPITYDPVWDVFEIYKMRFSGQFFRCWAEGGLKIGRTFRVENREDGLLWIKDV